MRNGGKFLFQLVLCLCFFCYSANAQTEQHYWSFRGGYLRSFPTLSEPTIPSPNLYRALGISPINSYYLGLAYTRIWNKLGFNLEGNIQRKGMTGIDLSQFTQFSPVNQYYYLNIAPLAHYNLTKNLSIQLGPEFNILLAKNSVFANSRSVEFGANARIGYSFNRLTLQVGTSHGFTPYSVSKFVGQDVFSIRNNTFQVGLAYRVKQISF